MEGQTKARLKPDEVRRGLRPTETVITICAILTNDKQTSIAIDYLVRTKITMTCKTICESYDVVIIGAGPAGLSTLSALQESFSLDNMTDCEYKKGVSAPILHYTHTFNFFF